MKLVIVIFLLTNTFAYGQKQDANNIFITGNFTDKKMEGKEIKIDYYQSYSFMAFYPPVEKYKKIVYNQSCKFEITKPLKIGYIRIFFPEPYGMDPINNLIFLCEAGDQVNLRIKDGTVHFYGKDAIKYNDQLVANSVVPTIKTTPKSTNSEYLNAAIKGYSDLFLGQVAVISKNKTKWNETAFNILKTNFLYSTYYNVTGIFRGVYRMSDQREKKDINFAFNKYIDEHASDTLPVDLALNSISALDFKFLKEMCSLEFANGVSNESFVFGKLFNNLLQNYKGDVKDRLLLMSTRATIFTRDSTDIYLDSTINIVNEEFSKKQLITQKKVFGKGSPAFKFHLNDTANRIYSPKDFYGKVFIMDFYFTGCSGCIALSKAMPPVLEEFRNNPDVVFISVNLDRSLKMFKDAVKGGKYTHPEYLNLYTNGKGYDHEMIQYYQINGCPTVLIFDKNGKMLNSDPPLPFVGPDATERFIKILKSGLVKSTI